MRRAARRFTLILIRAPRWAKQRRDNRIDRKAQGAPQGRSRVSQRVIRVYVALMALLGSVHNSMPSREVVSYKLHSTVLLYTVISTTSSLKTITTNVNDQRRYAEA